MTDTRKTMGYSAVPIGLIAPVALVKDILDRSARIDRRQHADGWIMCETPIAHSAIIEAFKRHLEIAQTISRTTLRIYRMNDCEWYAADSLNEAVELCMNDAGEIDKDNCIDCSRRIEIEELHKLQWCDDGGAPLHSFAEEFARQIEHGTLRKGLFATTEY